MVDNIIAVLNHTISNPHYKEHYVIFISNRYTHWYTGIAQSKTRAAQWLWRV